MKGNLQEYGIDIARNAYILFYQRRGSPAPAEVERDAGVNRPADVGDKAAPARVERDAGEAEARGKEAEIIKGMDDDVEWVTSKRSRTWTTMWRWVMLRWSPRSTRTLHCPSDWGIDSCCCSTAPTTCNRVRAYVVSDGNHFGPVPRGHGSQPVVQLHFVPPTHYAVSGWSALHGVRASDSLHADAGVSAHVQVEMACLYGEAVGGNAGLLPNRRGHAAEMRPWFLGCVRDGVVVEPPTLACGPASAPRIRQAVSIEIPTWRQHTRLYQAAHTVVSGRTKCIDVVINVK